MSNAIAQSPRGRLLTGHLPEFRTDALGFLSALAAEQGDVARFRLGPQKATLVSDPALVATVLHETNRHYTRHFLPRLSGSLLGLGLFTSEGDLWQRERRLIQPAFHREHAARWCESMTAAAEAAVASWDDGEVRDLHEDMVAVALEVVCGTLFGADVRDDTEAVADALTVIMDTFERRLHMAVPPPSWLPTPGNLRQGAAIRSLDRILHRIIRARRASGIPQGDVLDVLVRAQADDGTAMSDDQLRDEAMALFTGGHEPVAVGLSWTWYLLSQHPEVVAEVEQELTEVLGGRTPTAADLRRLVVTESVVKESMRLFPPSWAFDRKATTDVDLAGHRIDKGTVVVIAQWVLHRDGRLFDEPATFQPQRWLDGRTRDLPTYAYLPFGGGPRSCIGSSFATIEMVLVVATILQRARLGLAPGAVVEPQPTISLRPKHGLPMVVTRR